MKDNNNSPQNSENVSAKGFYIALAACVFVIGVAVWAMLMPLNTLRGANVEKSSNISVSGTEKSGTVSLPDSSFKHGYDSEVMTPQTETDSSASEVIAPEAADESEAVSVSAPVFMWPLYGTTAVGFFDDELVYNPTMMDWRTHPAIDIEAEPGAKVMAVADGTVKAVYNDDLLGTTVIISHGDELESVYSNLSESPTVAVGDSVAVGSVIGTVGNTAIGETGQTFHLHFAMTKSGEYVDPAEYLP